MCLYVGVAWLREDCDSVEMQFSFDMNEKKVVRVALSYALMCAVKLILCLSEIVFVIHCREIKELIEWLCSFTADALKLSSFGLQSVAAFLGDNF